MPPANSYPCPHCGASVTLKGARVFVPVPCPACGATMRARTDFAGYVLGEPLARSGLGVLFHATDPVTGVEFALKLLQPPTGTEPEDLGRFVAETRAVAALDHPHCVRVFGAGVEEGLGWVAMEQLTGGTLAGRLAGVGRLGEAEVLTLGMQAASALAAAHAAGVTHHDLEPNSFVFDESATLKLTDFGQAVFYERLSSEVGIIWGRPAYVPPERLARDDEDAQTDIYALGATLFRALTGTPPYDGEAHGQILFDRMGNEPIRVENHVRPIHTTTAAVLNRMLAASRAQRFHSWSEVLERLEQAHAALTGRSAPPPPPPPRLRAPTPRLSPSGLVAPDTVAKQAAKAAGDGNTLASLATLVMLGLTVAVLGVVAWKYWFNRPPRLALPAVVATPAVAPALPATPSAPAKAIRVSEPRTTPAPAKSNRIVWSGWKTANLESPKRTGVVKGTASIVPGSGALRMRGNATGMAGTTDECAFHARELAGDWILSARIPSRDGAAGLLAREGGSSSRPALGIWVSDGKVFTGLRRKAGAGAVISKPHTSAKTPWLRLIRRGSILAAHYSANGKEWEALEKLEGLELPAKIPAGFVVWSGSNQRTTGATFDQVTLGSTK